MVSKQHALSRRYTFLACCVIALLAAASGSAQDLPAVQTSLSHDSGVTVRHSPLKTISYDDPSMNRPPLPSSHKHIRAHHHLVPIINQRSVLCRIYLYTYRTFRLFMNVCWPRRNPNLSLCLVFVRIVAHCGCAVQGPSEANSATEGA